MGKIIDIYHGDTIKTFKDVKNECSVVFHKISQGEKLDSKFLTRAEAFEENDVPFWGYIYLNKDNEIDQIDFAWRNIQRKVKNYDNFIGIVLDVEANNTANDSLDAMKYLRNLCYSYHLKFGFYCGYSNLEKYKTTIDYVKGQSRGFIWVARYTNKYTVPDYVDLWQYTENGTINCLTNKGDINEIHNRNKHNLSWYTTHYYPTAYKVPLASTVVSNATNHVGYEEKKSNRRLFKNVQNVGYSNYTKFGEWIDCNGDYWCASFQSWLFYRSFGYSHGKEILGCPYSPACENLRKGMRTDKNPKVGDIVFFKGTRHSGANHVGLVYKVNEKKIYTIEGNASSESGVTDNGGSVVKKSYSRNDNKIICYGHPYYAEYYDGKLPTEYPKGGYFFNGCGKSDNNIFIKKFLVWYFGSDECDLNVNNNSYGDNMEKFVKKFQKEMGISQTGKWGKKCTSKAKQCVKYKGKITVVK